MWIYYYASFGPGHQSHDYGFEFFNDSYDMDDIEDSLHNQLRDHDGVVLDFWKIERPPADLVKKKIKRNKERVKAIRKYIKDLGSANGFVPEEEKGEDPVIQRNIRGCIIANLLYRLHKAGFMYSADDITKWRYGDKHPIEPSRKQILRIMRSATRYPSYKKTVGSKK
jgi:hypothetical protein